MESAMREQQGRKAVTARAPGNLLICGEYMILESGGLGIAMACGPQAEGKAWPASGPKSVVHAITGDGAISLNTAMDNPHPPFIINVYRSVLSDLNNMGLTLPPLEIEVDTRSFFRQGRKLGLGSSAAATVILASLMYAWVENVTMTDREKSRQQIAEIAVNAHRYAQGKRGSGYDILTSCHGSLGVFTGGEQPRWRHLRDDHPIFKLHSYSFPGPEEVDSRTAVQKYHNWKKHSPEGSQEFFRDSQTLMKRMEESSSEDEVLRLITELRMLYTELGEVIGVGSWISPPSPFYEKSAWKGSGAGNELGLLFLSRTSRLELDHPYESLHPDHDGLRLFSSNGDAIL